MPGGCDKWWRRSATAINDFFFQTLVSLATNKLHITRITKIRLLDKNASTAHMKYLGAGYIAISAILEMSRIRRARFRLTYHNVFYNNIINIIYYVVDL